jgi:hypothetical protein
VRVSAVLHPASRTHSQTRTVTRTDSKTHATLPLRLPEPSEATCQSIKYHSEHLEIRDYSVNELPLFPSPPLPSPSPPPIPSLNLQNADTNQALGRRQIRPLSLLLLHLLLAPPWHKQGPRRPQGRRGLRRVKSASPEGHAYGSGSFAQSPPHPTGRQQALSMGTNLRHEPRTDLRQDLVSDGRVGRRYGGLSLERQRLVDSVHCRRLLLYGT